MCNPIVKLSTTKEEMLQSSISPTLSETEISQLSVRFENLSTEAILKWAWDTFRENAVVSSSFQTQSIPLLHIISQTCPKLPIVFIDTGFHFPETLAFRDELQSRYGLNIIVVRPSISKSQLFQQHGEGLYRRDPDLCCYINKVEPMQRLLSTKHAWIAGVRRDQTQNRKGLHVLEPQSTGLLKIHPMLNWTKEDIQAYIHEHNLPPHPLYEQGYRSIGCAPCTRPVLTLEDDRSGRWSDSGKTECGLHLDWNTERGKHGESEK